MASNGDVDLVVLKRAINKIFDYMINDLKVDHVKLDSDLYWEIGKEYKYNLKYNPPEFEAGNLHDDWEFVSDIPDEEGIPSVFSFTEIASILQYIGETFEQFRKSE